MLESEEVDFIDVDKLLVTCYHDGAIEIHNGDKVISVYSNEFGDDGSVFTDSQNYVVDGVDDEEFYFTMLVDKYFNLEPDYFELANSEDYIPDTDEYVSTKYLYVYFKNHHFFKDYDDQVTVIFPDEEVEVEEELVGLELIGEVFDSHCIRFRLTPYDLADCSDTEDDDERDRCEASNSETERINFLIQNNIVASRLLALYSGLINNYDEFDNFLENLYGLTVPFNANGYRFIRNNFMFDDVSETDNISIGILKPSTILKVPLFSKFSTDLNQETNISDAFTKVEIKKSINPIDDREKDVYSPVCFDGDDATEIRFNLHFRQHRGDDWSVEKESSWNGVKENHELMDSSNSTSYGYFSYTGNKDAQSDLLYYLGFTDGDVKYRKNKLKMSFLRLLFYDSTQLTKQNLLAYSTIFIDAGKLYGKYMRNFDYPKNPSESFGYSRIKSDSEDGETKTNLSGSRVNREPYWGSPHTDYDETESLRLSSQFVVKDKYSSESSSEGFYLYLWKDMADTMPGDIYMKVEFNHAGYGRTIPFMMPYGDNGVKSFSEIAEDDGYEIIDYIKYSYIHLKYKYDSANHRCIYYPDEMYRLGNNGIIEFNLYEAKVK
jgi:hypothetical protein